MRKGLTTLLTVAIALVSAQAMAIAPTIFDIPSPIVGGGTGSSQVTKYVYPDAFDLNTLAADDNTPADQLKWSYEAVNTKYAINGIATINSSTEDPINPITTKDINHALATAETKDIDKKPNTVTIRNIRLAPLTGTPATDTTAGIIDQQPVTFWCSDGTAVSSQTVMFYTDNYPWGNNRLQTVWKLEKADYLTKSWTTVEGPFGDTTTRTMADGRGICFEVAQLNNNFASMSSPYAFFSLTQNSVYRIRATMNNSQASVGHTPFWDFLVDNYQGVIDATKGLNLYGMDAMFLDNEGGANTVIQKENGTEYTFYWAPASFRTQAWNKSTKGSGGAYDPDNSANKDPYLRFRVMDITNNKSLNSEQKFGTLCLQKVFVESIPFTSLQAGNVLYQVGSTSPTNVIKGFKGATNTAPGGNVFIKGLVGTQVLYPSNGAYVTLKPSSTAAQGKEYTVIQPAVDLKGINTGDGGIVLTSPYTDILDDFPIAWTPNKLLMLEVDLSAPDATSEAHPWDYMIMSMESATNEMMFESYITANKKIATPKVGTQQTYTMFFNTMNETKSAVANFHFLRWRLRFANNDQLNWPAVSDKTNVGAVRIHRVAVTEMSVKVTQ